MADRRSSFTKSLFDKELPADWTLVPARAVVDRTQYGLNEPGASNGGTPIVGMKDIANGAVNLSNLGTIDGDANAWTAYVLRRDDILLNRTNSPDLVGKVGIVREDSQAVFASYLVRLHVNKERGDPAFLNYWFNGSIAQRALKRLSTRGVSQANINPTEFLKHCPVPLPPLPEQHKIGEILRTWDDAIQKLTALGAAKSRDFQALARQFFGPCHPSHQRSNGTWNRFELGDVFQERSECGSDGEVLLSITMSDGVIDREDVGRKDTSNEDKSRYKLILPGDIGYNTMRMWQGVSGLSSLRGIVSPAYTIVTPDNKNISARYAAHLFKSRRMVFDFQRYSQGMTSDTWGLKFPAFSKIAVFLPPIDLQRKQADLLDAMTAEIAALDKQRLAVERQKRGLMQKLLTGEWRINTVASDLRKPEAAANG
ncbi:MAG: restriction endonuclease subunit S [Rhodospirillaceae bacterium]